jgi:cathepsin A (carboxypeptidase C)
LSLATAFLLISFSPAANLNHYDLRKPCSDEEREHLCYDEIAHQEVFLNKPEVQAALGVGPMKFQECNTKIAIAYQAQGGAVRDTVHLLPDLINAGIRVLAYAGTTDAVCNFMGVESFVEHLGTAFQDEFADAKPQPWVVGDRTAGYVRAAGGDGTTAGNQTFVAVYEAG